MGSRSCDLGRKPTDLQLFMDAQTLLLLKIDSEMRIGLARRALRSPSKQIKSAIRLPIGIAGRLACARPTQKQRASPGAPVKLLYRTPDRWRLRNERQFAMYLALWLVLWLSPEVHARRGDKSAIAPTERAGR
jgi:hypothetical protein